MMPRSHGHAHERRDVLNHIGRIVDGQGSGDMAERRDGQGNIAARAQSTVVQIVYKTMEPTFLGPIAGYSTLNEDDSPAPTNAPNQQLTTTPTTQPSAKATPSSAVTSVPTAIRPPSNTDTDTLGTVLVQATGTPNTSPTLDLDTTLPTSTATATASTAASASATADPASSSSQATGSGTSTAAKAGIAFGVVGGVVIVALLVLLAFRRRRRQTRRQQLGEDDEKVNGAIARQPEPMIGIPARTNPNAPRISLRPVTQFFPNWSLEKHAAGAMSIAASGNNSDRPDRPDTSQSNHSANPFGNQAERVPTPVSERVPTPVMSPVIEEDIEETQASPSDNAVNGKAPATDGNAVAAGAVAGAVVGAAAVAGAGALTRKASMRNQNPHNVDYTVSVALGPIPPSPSGTEFSMNSANTGSATAPSKGAAAIAAAGGPPNSTVHRVQLDFKPTLEDEMELKAGDLVRLLHEYDDGWALVIRLDRSKQGVIPRTCLSTRPVKPRPAQGRPPVNPSGYPRGPNGPPGQRSMTPQGQHRPMTPQGQQRPMTPQGMQANGGPASRPRMGPGPGQGPRPASPAGLPMNQSPTGRPMSPAGRPMSPSGRYQGPPSGRPQSPGGSSPMNAAQPPASGAPSGAIGRKPVPGQAY